MKYTRLFFAAAIAGILFSGCKETTVISPAAPGNITGYVQLYDTLSQPLADQSGVTVSLPGTSISAQSDRSGKWTLQNVPPGTYTIFFSKDGYSSMKDFNLQFIGNGTYYYSYTYNGKNGPMTLNERPSLYPDLVLRPFEDSTYFQYRIAYDSNGYQYYIIDTITTKNNNAIFSSRSRPYYNGNYVSTLIYFSKTNTIDPLDPRTFLFSEIGYNYQNSYDSLGVANISIRRNDLLTAGFSSGETIYCCAYAGQVYYNGGYYYYGEWFDQEFNQYIYGGLSEHHSIVASFLLP